MTNRALAETVGLSESACLDRVKRLEQTGVIAGYRAELDAAKLGAGIAVYAQVTLAQHGNRRQQAFEAWVAACPDVAECAEVSGACDYVLRFVCSGIAAYQDLTARLIEDEALGVSEIKSHIVMRSVKTGTGLPLALLGEAETA